MAGISFKQSVSLDGKTFVDTPQTEQTRFCAVFKYRELAPTLLAKIAHVRENTPFGPGDGGGGGGSLTV